VYAAALADRASTPRWLIWLARAATLGLAALYLLRPDLPTGAWPPLPSVWDLSDREIVLAWAASVARAAVIDLARWVPLGLFARLALGGRSRWIARVTLGWVPALAIVLAVAAASRVLEVGAIGPVRASTALAGALVGVWAGSALLAGARACAWFVPKLAGAVVVLALIAAGIGHLALTPPEDAIDEAAPSVADRVRLARMFETLPNEAGLRTVRLGGADIGHLIAWRWPPDQRRWRVQITFVSDRALVEVSTPVPLGGRVLAVSVLLDGAVRRGALELEVEALGVGRLDVPVALVRPFLRRAVDHARSDRDVQRLLVNAESARVAASGLEVRGRRPALDQALLSRLAGVGAPGVTSLPDLRENVTQLLGAAAAGAGDALFVALLRAGFAHAQARTRAADADPVEANRGVLLALGLVLGHTQLEQLTGPVLDDAQRRAAREIAGRASMRDRSDWSRHFTVSAALALLGAPDLSDVGGVLKEELDARGGSGFSFADLLADRAGTTLAVAATRDQDTAGRLQGRLAAGVAIEDLLPDPGGLAEGLEAAVLAERYGGVGGAAYRAVALDLEARIARLPIYRP
jgi:hypothetical protein